MEKRTACSSTRYGLPEGILLTISLMRSGFFISNAEAGGLFSANLHFTGFREEELIRYKL